MIRHDPSGPCRIPERDILIQEVHLTLNEVMEEMPSGIVLVIPTAIAMLVIYAVLDAILVKHDG